MCNAPQKTFEEFIIIIIISRPNAQISSELQMRVAAITDRTRVFSDSG